MPLGHPESSASECLQLPLRRKAIDKDWDAIAPLFTNNLILNRIAIALPPLLQQLRRHQTLRKKDCPQNNQHPKNN